MSTVHSLGNLSRLFCTYSTFHLVFSSSPKLSKMAASAHATSALIRDPNTAAVALLSHRPQSDIPSISFLKSTSSNSTKRHLTAAPQLSRAAVRFMPRSSAEKSSTGVSTFHGLCYVVKDNIDTDQIIPAEYLTLVPSKPDEYKKLGSYAMIGLPESYETRFIDPGESETKYSIVIAGDNFGCGSSREHAPVALGAAGVKAVVAESYARIFFRNSVATGEVYPLECEARISDKCKTGDVVTIELKENKLINHTTGKEFGLKPIGDAGPVIEAGGIFAYARKAGMIPAQQTA